MTHRPPTLLALLAAALTGHYIRDVRKDLSAPKMPFVIGVMGAGGPVDKYPEAQRKRYGSTHRGFREAMAAPAALPGFKGNVAAVLTENFWDMELTELRTRDRTIQQEVDASIKEGKLAAKDKNPTLEKRRADAFTERERKILADGASNAEFHYLGSAKILGQIGKAFAEAQQSLRRKDSQPAGPTTRSDRRSRWTTNQSPGRHGC